MQTRYERQVGIHVPGVGRIGRASTFFQKLFQIYTDTHGESTYLRVLYQTCVPTHYEHRAGYMPGRYCELHCEL